MRKRFNFGTLLLASLAGCCISTTVLAEEPVRTDAPVGVQVPANSPAARFGVKHELAIASDAGFSISNTSVSGVEGSATTFSMRPAVDFFIIDDLSLGGTFGLDYTNNPVGHATTFSIGPRVGYNFTLGEKFSLWPKVGFAYNHTSVTVDAAAVPGAILVDPSRSNNGLGLSIYVPFMVHPVEHFFLGLGPALDVDLTGDARATTFAGRLTIGGWLGPLAKK